MRHYTRSFRGWKRRKGGGRRSENLVGDRGEASRDEARPIHLFHRIGSDSAECDVTRCDVIRICARESGVVVVGVIGGRTGLTWYFLSRWAGLWSRVE